MVLQRTGLKHFLEMNCQNKIEIMVNDLKKSSEFFGQECKDIFLGNRKILKTCICGHPRTSLAPGIQDPLHANEIQSGTEANRLKR